MVIDSSNYAAKPAVVVVNGSFCPELFYSDMKEEFSKAGYEAVVANIPSIGNGDRLPAATVAEDASHIHSITSKLANQGKDVVLMTHSYGGIPGTESAQGLAKKEREAVGKVGGIVRLIYMTSVVPPVGKSLGDLLGDSLPETIEVQVCMTLYSGIVEALRSLFAENRVNICVTSQTTTSQLAPSSPIFHYQRVPSGRKRCHDIQP